MSELNVPTSAPHRCGLPTACGPCVLNAGHTVMGCTASLADCWDRVDTATQEVRGHGFGACPKCSGDPCRCEPLLRVPGWWTMTNGVNGPQGLGR